MNTAADPPDPSDPSDPVRELLLETYQPSRAGVEMTAVLNKLPQMICVFWKNKKSNAPTDSNLKWPKNMGFGTFWFII